MDLLKRIWCDESGQDLAEYGLLLVLIVVATAFAVSAFGETLGSIWSRIADSLSGIGEVEIAG